VDDDNNFPKLLSSSLIVSAFCELHVILENLLWALTYERGALV